jgi:LPXTG-motif cell wall-anchored protein
MRVVIAIIALILFVLLARFVYLKVRDAQTVNTSSNTVLPVPSPSYFPAFSPTPSPSATSSATTFGSLNGSTKTPVNTTGKTTAKATPAASTRPTATASSTVNKLPSTGGNELTYIFGAIVVGAFGLMLRRARA